MSLFLPSLIAFVGALAVHLIWWRIRLPERQIRALLILFVVVFAVQTLSSYRAAAVSGYYLAGLIHAFLLYWGMAFSYVITYSALEGDSPTLSLMRFVADRPAGVSRSQLDDFLASRPFVAARTKALETEGLIIEKNGRLFAASSPPLLFRAVLGWRKLLGISEQGG